MEDTESGQSELKECCRCRELESKCVELEAKIDEYKTLEVKFKALEVEKIEIEEELKALKKQNNGNRESCGKEREGIVDLTGEGEEDSVVQLMIENSVLECEKRKAENEVEILKQKLKELGINVSEAVEDKRGNGSVSGKSTGGLQKEETLFNCSPSENIAYIKGEKGSLGVESKMEYGRRVRKRLAFEEDQSPCKKIAPATPSGDRTSSLGVINLCDTDEEPDMAHVQLPSVGNQGNGIVCISTQHALERFVGSEKETSKGTAKRALLNHCYEENTANCDDDIPFISTPKRKRASNVVTSDTESVDEDDNIPICKLKRMHLQEIICDRTPFEKSCSAGDSIANLMTRPRRRLVSLRKCAEKSGVGKSSSSKTYETKCQRGVPTTDDFEDKESEKDGSESEGESLNGFIVESSEGSDGDDVSSEDKDESDDNVDFGDILSRIKRSKDQKLEWDFEADMLAAFGKDPELCMKAVCALYRQQTHEEKVSKGSLVYNHRGFSKFDAHRGTTLAEFLTDGDPQGDLKKSVKQLHEYDTKGVEKCRTFATRYSKQLFEIYKNKEDPLFLAS